MKFTYWDIGSRYVYYFQEYCRKHNIDKSGEDELFSLVLELLNDDVLDDKFKKKLDFEWHVEQAEEEGQRRGYDEGYDQGVDDGESNQERETISVEKHNRDMNRKDEEIKENYRNGYIAGFKKGINWEPAPDEFPELKHL